MRKFYLLIYIFLLCACAPTKSLSSHIDSDRVKVERVVDTIEVVSRDTTLLNALMECDSLGRIRIASIKSKNNQLAKMQTVIDSNRIKVKVVSSEVVRWREHTKIDTIYLNSSEVIVKEVKMPIPKWKQYLMWIGVATILFVGVSIFIKIKRFF